MIVSPLFNFPSADLVLRSAPSPHPVDFLVHRYVLSAASPFFALLFTLPQAPDDDDPRPIIDVAESPETLEALFRFIYPMISPTINSPDHLVHLLETATKYDFNVVIDALSKVLIEPRFLEARPVWVYATATRYDLEEEAKTASEHTLKINIHDDSSCEDIKLIPSYSYRRLLELHDRRSREAIDLLHLPKDIRCVLCNGTYYAILWEPEWWRDFEKRAKEELKARPCSDKIFSDTFLSKSAEAGCQRCRGNISDAREFLASLKRDIDALPSTVR